MNDEGLSAAMQMALCAFDQASRATGRTTRMIESARPGDVIFTINRKERDRLEYELRKAGKNDVTVRVTTIKMMECRDSSMKRQERGSVIFDHLLITEYWTHNLSQIREQLAALEQLFSTAPPPKSPPRRLADQHARWATY